MGRRIKKKLFPGTLVAQMVKNLPAMWETQVPSLVRKDLWRREWQPTPVYLPRESNGQRSLAISQRIGHNGAAHVTNTLNAPIGDYAFHCLWGPKNLPFSWS